MNFVEARWFERFILWLIILSTLFLAFRNNEIIQSGEINGLKIPNIVFGIEIFIEVIFVLESILKILAHGFIYGNNAYLRNGWNVLDFIIITSSVCSFFLKELRVLRILRPFRVIKRWESLLKFTEALISSMPKISVVLSFLLFMIFLFGVVGV